MPTDLINELEQYRRILNNIPAEIGVFDPQGRFLFNTPSGIRDPEVRAWVLGKTHHDFCRRRDYPIEIADRRQAAVIRGFGGPVAESVRRCTSARPGLQTLG